MITFIPIHKLIQETLLKKMDMLSKNGNSYSIGTPVNDKNALPSNYMFTRTPFLRMTSLLTKNNNPIIITGGEMKDNKFQFGYDGIYGSKNTDVVNASTTGEVGVIVNPNLLKRPIAGIKDVSVEYKGGGMKLGATRTTSISWTCWTWDELQRLKPYFLKHGRTVLVEFGWSFSGKNSVNLINIIKENGEINSDDTVLNNLQEKLPEHILQQKGNYDAVLGKIQNFEFSVNDTGGFDCTTDIVSLGVTTLEKLDTKESLMGHITKLPIVNPVKDDFWFFPGDDDFLVNLKDKDPYYNFISYMKSLEGHLHLNALNSKGSIAYILGNQNPACTWGWFEDNVLSRFIGLVNEKSKVVSEFRSIENIYNEKGEILKSQPVKIRASSDVLAVNFDEWYFALGGGDKTANAKNEDNSILIPKYNLLVGSTSNPENFKMMFGPPYVQISDDGTGKTKIHADDWKKQFLGDEDAKWNYEGSYFRVFLNKEKNTGTLRNVYFNHKFLTDNFVGASSIRDGIMKVWNKFSNAYGGIYEFRIDYDDKEGRLLLRDTGFSENKVEDELKNKSTNEDYDIANPGVFVFPIWENTSMVKSQNLSAKLPSRMQVAAMYGSQNASIFSDGVVNDYSDWGGVALGKAEREGEEEDDSGEKLLQDLIYGGIEHPFRRTEVDDKTTRWTFGNATAESGSLSWKDSASKTTTDIYEDTSKDYNRFGTGINEVLNEQLTDEFQKRINISMGLNPTASFDVGDEGAVNTRIALWRNREKNDKLAQMYISPPGGVRIMQESVMWDKDDVPKLKEEYVGIMRMALKGDKAGLLKQSDPIVPIELELEIDGTGGLFPGNSFHSSYLPKSYMNKICFQIKGSSHKIDSTGWTTTIQGQMRVAGYSVPTGSELDPTPPKGDKSTKTNTSTPAEDYNVDTGFVTNEKRGETLEVTYTTSAVDKSGVDLKNQDTEFLAKGPVIESGDNTEKYNKAVSNLAHDIQDDDEYWQANHLLNIANEIDYDNLGGDSNGSGLGFLQWFRDSPPKKGYEIWGRDLTRIEEARNEYLAEMSYRGLTYEIPTTLNLDILGD